MKILHYRLVKNNVQVLFLVLMSISLFGIYVTKNFYLIFITAFCFFSLIRKWKYIIYSIIIFLLFLTIYKFFGSKAIVERINGKYEIHKTGTMGFVVKHKGSNIFIFSRKYLYKGDIVFISGKTNIYEGKLNNYFRSLNIKSVIYKPKIHFLHKGVDLFSKIRNHFIRNNGSNDIINSLLIFGQKIQTTKDFYKITSNLNVAHFFVISGMHISFIYLFLSKVLFRMKKLNKDILILFLIFIYLFLIGFSVSALRAFIMILLSKGSKYFKKIKISKIEILAISLFIIVLIDPYSVFGFSLPLTFIATGIILVINDIDINKWKKLIIISFSMSGLMLPFTIMFNGGFNIFSPLFNIFIAPIFSVFYIINIILLPFKSAQNFISSIFIDVVSKLEILAITIPVNKKFFILFLSPYVLFAISFIIYEIWNLFLEKKNILLILKSRNI